MLSPSKRMRFWAVSTRRMTPLSPLFLPAMTMTLSPFLSFILQNFRGQGADLLVAALDDLARDRAEDARCFRFLLVFFYEHDRVLVEADVAAVFAAECFF